MLFTKNQVNRAFKKGLKEMSQFKGFELLRLKDFYKAILSVKFGVNKIFIVDGGHMLGGLHGKVHTTTLIAK